MANQLLQEEVPQGAKCLEACCQDQQVFLASLADRILGVVFVFNFETPPCSAKSLKKGFRERSEKGRFEVILEMGGHREVVLSIPPLESSVCSGKEALKKTSKSNFQSCCAVLRDSLKNK